MSSVIYIHVSQLANHFVTRDTPHNNIEHTHAKILLIAFERQVSWGDTNNEVVDH